MISGGLRKPAGPGQGQVKAGSVSLKIGDPTCLVLRVSPVGDYSTYTLSLNSNQIDPFFSELAFKFRPGCFSINCSPEWAPSPERTANPVIDYLAKDYDSFRHTLIAAMMARVPGWQPVSEADFTLALVELLSAGADELSDYQDRVMSEAYLATARKRVSLARHGRLMDYHIHQGSQASTVLALRLAAAAEIVVAAGFAVATESQSRGAQVFLSHQDQVMHPLLNDMSLYTWNDETVYPGSSAVVGLPAGSTCADLKLATNGELAAKTVQDLIRDGKITRLLIQAHLNPDTGQPAGTDPGLRQIVHLKPGAEGAEALQDPLTHIWFVRVRWEDMDQLQRSYCFVTQCPDGERRDVARFHGNLLQVYHGRPATLVFKEPGAILDAENQRHFQRTRWGALCDLSQAGPLAYHATPPGGEVWPVSTLKVQVDPDADDWEEAVSLVLSQGQDAHFCVETDELQNSRIRFGNGVNGKELPLGSRVTCTFQAGLGLEGNVGRDRLTVFTDARIAGCWNPFDVTNGLGPEPVAEIIRRIPEAYLRRQMRCVTLEDYRERAEELPEVSRAAACYQWTGSWRTVRITIDPAGTTALTPEARERISRHLEAVRLIGEDLEIRPPKFVPASVRIGVCVRPDYWVDDVRVLLEHEFSTGFTPDGRRGFFHPDSWTFGQPLHASQIEGRALLVQGVDFVKFVELKRWNEPTPGPADRIEVAANEIILAENNPDHMERGYITWDIQGGRR